MPISRFYMLLGGLPSTSVLVEALSARNMEKTSVPSPDRIQGTYQSQSTAEDLAIARMWASV